jgi:Ras-related protein Rab-1A
MNIEYDYLFKIVLVGDSGVGKSSLVLKYTDGIYSDAFISTIGVDFKIHTLVINNKKIKLQIWDTAGQERFKSITCNYYRGATCVIFVYDITNIESFDNLLTWINEMKNYSNNKYAYIVGNKYDIVEKNKNNRQVSIETVANFAKEHNMSFIESSAKSGFNVETIFKQISSEIIDNQILCNTKDVLYIDINNNNNCNNNNKYCGC